MIKTCEVCGNEYDDKSYPHNGKYCSTKCQTRQRYIRNKEIMDARSKAHYRENRERILKVQAEAYRLHPEKYRQHPNVIEKVCAQCGKEFNDSTQSKTMKYCSDKCRDAVGRRTYRDNNLAEIRKKTNELHKTPEYKQKLKDHRRKIKIEVFSHYGGKCTCCGEDRIEFLTIDHINGGGSRHRERLGGGGILIYRWLIKNNYPEGYRVLCFNCNCAMGFFGYCPHEKERTLNDRA